MDKHEWNDCLPFFFLKAKKNLRVFLFLCEDLFYTFRFFSYASAFVAALASLSFSVSVIVKDTIGRLYPHKL